MNTEIHISIFDLFIFLGVFQGLMLAWYMIINSGRQGRSNLYQGLLLLSLSACMFEEFLNNTGFIVQVLPLSNFAEPLNLAMPPLFYLYMRYSLRPGKKSGDWLHFIVFAVYLLYMGFYFVQTNEYKYNSYIDSKHPDWQFLIVKAVVPEDPLSLRENITLITTICFFIYIFLAVYTLLKHCSERGIKVLATSNVRIRILRNSVLHFIMIMLIFLFVKIRFPGDVGDYFISTYISFMIISSAFRIMGDSTSFEQTSSFMDFPLNKYKKSSLSVEGKQAILRKIETEMGEKKYFMNNMASLGDMSKNIKESQHHVSQVINEMLGMSFFELLAKYRIDEARSILLNDAERKLTIEEVAERVGYNSKSAFNNAFRRLTSCTPSEYRERNTIC